MRKCWLLLAVLSIFTILLSINAKDTLGAYNIWPSSIIQYKVHENGDKEYKLALYISDEGGMVSDDVVTNAKLTDPNGKTVPLSSLDFTTVSTYTRGEFIVNDAGWAYPTSPSETYGDWSAEIQTPLITGEYTLEVTTDDGKNHIIYADFEHFEIPVISSCTFQLNQDEDGNIYWTWDIPKDLLELAKGKKDDEELFIRAGIESYLNDEWSGLIYVDTPVIMGFCFFPNDKLEYLQSIGDEIRFFIHVRNRKSYNRSYSNKIPVTDFSKPLEISIFCPDKRSDIDGDGAIDGYDLSIFSEYFGTIP